MRVDVEVKRSDAELARVEKSCDDGVDDTDGSIGQDPPPTFLTSGLVTFHAPLQAKLSLVVSHIN